MRLIDTPAGWVRRLVAVIIAMTATMAALVGTSAPASAATCSSSSGVSVITDFTNATGGIRTACVPGGGGQFGDELLAAAGFKLSWVARQPGFLCRIDGVPAGDPCVNTPPASAYWGVFWSDGEDGVWHYSDFGIGGLQVPDGGYLGLAFQTGTRRAPAQAATIHPTATPTPTPTSTAAPTANPAPTPGSSTTTTTKPTRGPKPSGTGTTNPKKGPTTTSPSTPKGSAEPTATPQKTSTPDPSTSASSDAPEVDPTTADPSGTASTTASNQPAPSAADSEKPSATASEPTTDSSKPSEAAETAPGSVEPAARAPEESDRVPTWLTLGILVLLLAAITVSSLAARRARRP